MTYAFIISYNSLESYTAISFENILSIYFMLTHQTSWLIDQNLVNVEQIMNMLTRL